MINTEAKDTTFSMDDEATVPPNTIKHGFETKEDPYTLSDLDMIMPDSLAIPLLIYELQTQHDVNLIIASFRRGFNEAVKRLPLLAATIHFDRSKKPLRRMTYKPPNLTVRFFEPGLHKSYQELAKSFFSPDEFDRRLLLPETANENAIEKPLCVPQLNVIPGGIILALGFNHLPLDMAAMELAIALICRCTKACMEGSPVEHTPLNYNRSFFAASPELVSLSREALLAQLPGWPIVNTAESTEDDNTQSLGSSEMVLKRAIYRIPEATARRLKECCSPVNGATYLSTHDCVVGLLWSSVIRIRAAQTPSLKESTSQMSQPVDLRDRPGSEIPRNYFGNAISVVSTAPVPVSDLIGPHGPSVAASCIRKSVVETTQASIAPLTALSATLGPTECLQYRPPGSLRENFLASSWYSVDTSAWDFGIGAPRMVRTWAQHLPGCATIFPDCSKNPSERTYDLLVILSEEEQNLLSQDVEMRSWFQVL